MSPGISLMSPNTPQESPYPNAKQQIINDNIPNSPFSQYKGSSSSPFISSAGNSSTTSASLNPAYTTTPTPMSAQMTPASSANPTPAPATPSNTTNNTSNSLGGATPSNNGNSNVLLGGFPVVQNNFNDTYTAKSNFGNTGNSGNGSKSVGSLEAEIQKIKEQVDLIKNILDKPVPPPPRKNTEIEQINEIKKILVEQVLPKISTEKPSSNQSPSNQVPSKEISLEAFSDLSSSNVSDLLSKVDSRLELITNKIANLEATLSQFKHEAALPPKKEHLLYDDYIIFVVFVVLLILATVRAV